jgi:hypothetical protein
MCGAVAPFSKRIHGVVISMGHVIMAIHGDNCAYLLNVSTFGTISVPKD